MTVLTFNDDRDRSILQDLGLALQLLLLPHIHELSLQHVLPPPPTVVISPVQLWVLWVLREVTDERLLGVCLVT